MPKGFPKSGVNKGWFKKGHKLTEGCKKGWFKQGHTGHWKGKEMSEETKKKMSESGKKVENSGRFEKGNIPVAPFEKGNVSWNTGLPSEKQPLWRGGISKEPYSFDFNEELKESIRKRDLYRCQECFRHQSELKRKLCVHHIDYDKKNSHPTNLISLCNPCHMQTNYGREDWSNYFQNRLEEGGLN